MILPRVARGMHRRLAAIVPGRATRATGATRAHPFVARGNAPDARPPNSWPGATWPTRTHPFVARASPPPTSIASPRRRPAKPGLRRHPHRSRASAADRQSPGRRGHGHASPGMRVGCAGGSQRSFRGAQPGLRARHAPTPFRGLDAHPPVRSPGFAATDIDREPPPPTGEARGDVAVAAAVPAYQFLSLVRSRATACEWSWQIRDSLTSRTAAISLKFISSS